VFSSVVPTAIGSSNGIKIHASELLEVLGGAQINTSTQGQGNAGNIELKTTTFIAQGESPQGFAPRIISQVSPGGTGHGGAISLIALGSMELRDGTQIVASTHGQGDGGLIDLQTPTFLAQGVSSQGVGTGVFSKVEPGARGNAGGIHLIASELIQLQDGGSLSASTNGTGNAGAITLVTGSFLAQGESPQGFVSGVTSQVNPNATGNSGGIHLTASESIALRDGAFLSASTYGAGNAGAIDLATTRFLAQGESSQGFVSRVLSQVNDRAVGNSGGIHLVAAESIALQDGAFICASTFGTGHAGTLDLRTTRFLAQGTDLQGFGAWVYSQVGSSGVGNSGGILLTASESVQLLNQARISARTAGQGNAGPITLTTPTLELRDGAEINSETQGSGNASAITLHAPRSIVLGENTRLTVETSDSGTPGNITLSTPSLTLQPNSQLSATVTPTSTNTQGGGNITLNASEIDLSGKLGIFAETASSAPAGSLVISPYGREPNLAIQFRDQGFISASTTASGNGGNITLSAPQSLILAGQGSISVETRSSGNAGSIQITAPEVRLTDGVTVSASTYSPEANAGRAGDITLTSTNLTLNPGTTLRTDTFGRGNSGNIKVTATGTIDLNGGAIEAITGENSSGTGGNIDIDPIDTYIRNGGRVAVDSQGTGTGGSVRLVSGNLTLDQGTISAITRSANGGNITLILGNLLQMRNGSVISTEAGTASSGGNGGDIAISAQFVLATPGSNSDIIANAFEGRGGSINIDAQGIFGFRVGNTNAPRINSANNITASSQFGTSGTITTPTVDPSQGLSSLPANLVDPSSLIDRRCTLQSKAFQSRFIILGRGGMAPAPIASLSLSAPLADLRLSLGDGAEPSGDDTSREVVVRPVGEVGFPTLSLCPSGGNE
jgi:large exoprotein involved in heme utilization and adhesion